MWRYYEKLEYVGEDTRDYVRFEEGEGTLIVNPRGEIKIGRNKKFGRIVEVVELWKKHKSLKKVFEILNKQNGE